VVHNENCCKGEGLAAVEHKFVTGRLVSAEGKHEFTHGVPVIHDNFRLLEVLVAAQFGGAFDGFQISGRAGFADPVLAARVA
jgi:hypothetical protein